jgi:hypothetical protein
VIEPTVTSDEPGQEKHKRPSRLNKISDRKLDQLFDMSPDPERTPVFQHSAEDLEKQLVATVKVGNLTNQKSQDRSSGEQKIKSQRRICKDKID